MPRPRSSSAGSTSSRCPTSTRRSSGRRAAPRPRPAWSRCARTCPCEAGGGHDIDARQAAELAARTSYGRLVAYLAARWRDVARAQDALGDALLAALETWPKTGVPDKPEAWLLTAARRHLMDGARHTKVAAAAAADLRVVVDEAHEEATSETV